MNDKTTFNFGSTSLIQLIKARPCLWDHSCPHYKIRLPKEEAWREIYCEMVPEFDSLPIEQQNDLGNRITRRWYNIRDAYVKWLRGGKYRRPKPYLYHEQLEFYKRANYNNIEVLDETLLEANEDEMAARSIDGLDYSRDCKDGVLGQDDNPLDNDDVLGYVVSELSDPQADSGARGSKRRRPSSSTDPMAEVLLKLLKKNDDEDEAFFNSILPDVRTMSTTIKREFRIEILRVIKRLLRKQRTKIKNSEESDEDSE